jgi:hypothetical protein
VCVCVCVCAISSVAQHFPILLSARDAIMAGQPALRTKDCDVDHAFCCRLCGTTVFYFVEISLVLITSDLIMAYIASSIINQQSS